MDSIWCGSLLYPSFGGQKVLLLFGWSTTTDVASTVWPVVSVRVCAVFSVDQCNRKVSIVTVFDGPGTSGPSDFQFYCCHCTATSRSNAIKVVIAVGPQLEQLACNPKRVHVLYAFILSTGSYMYMYLINSIRLSQLNLH